ncbi:hypothetical protein P2C08_20975 [Xanthomonas perforans]|uniref:hypothetical protein n=1 Tax=Xanthomonas perforans TaxID=442694 RepID=UPI001C638D21|nr:hypothetical protein [Xanthomonas perforans]
MEEIASSILRQGISHHLHHLCHSTFGANCAKTVTAPSAQLAVIASNPCRLDVVRRTSALA